MRKETDDEFGDEFMPVLSKQTQNPLESETEEPVPDPAKRGTGSQVPNQGNQSSSRRYRLRTNLNPPDRFGH